MKTKNEVKSKEQKLVLLVLLCLSFASFVDSFDLTMSFSANCSLHVDVIVEGGNKQINNRQQTYRCS